jgi:hypothetical protein
LKTGLRILETLRSGKRHKAGVMIAVPILADLTIRWAFGLAVSILMIPWRAVPLPFFRTQAHVILGLLVLAALDQARTEGHNHAIWLIVAAAISVYSSAVAWGLGLPRFGLATAAFTALAAAGWLTAASGPAEIGWWLARAASRLCSGFLLGATLTAMLLGHHYLTAPAMTTKPFMRALVMMAWGLGARCLLAGIGLWSGQSGHVGPGASGIEISPAIFLAVRWGLGFVAAGISLYMTWRTAQIRSTQSATGILYVTMIFVLFGEVTSLVLARRDGVMC